MKALTILAVTAGLAVSGLAQAAPLPPVCKGGILADAVTGRPMLGPNRERIPCDLPQAQADSGLDPTLAVLGSLVVVGGAVGAAVGLSGGGGCTNKLVPVSGGAIPICN